MLSTPSSGRLVGHGTLQHFVAWCVELGVLVEQGGIHLGVAVDALDALVPLLLNLPCLDDPLADGGRRLTLRCTRKLFKRHTRDFYMQIYPTEDYVVRKSY